jgi:hypothetical protein
MRARQPLVTSCLGCLRRSFEPAEDCGSQWQAGWPREPSQWLPTSTTAAVDPAVRATGSAATARYRLGVRPTGATHPRHAARGSCSRRATPVAEVVALDPYARRWRAQWSGWWAERDSNQPLARAFREARRAGPWWSRQTGLSRLVA